MEAFLEQLSLGVTHHCRAWDITRRDGVVMGFTDHDLDLEFEGIRYLASTGFDVGTIERSLGLNVDNTQVQGALSAAGLSEEDLLAGRYDSASVRHWLVDWVDPDVRLLMFRGTLGEVRQGSGAFEVELRGQAEHLNRPVGRVFVRSCDRALGDQACGINLQDQAYSIDLEIGVTTSNQIFSLSGLEGFLPGWFERGSILWRSGVNAGLVSPIRVDALDGTTRRIELWEAVSGEIHPTDTLTLRAGCDKTADTCHLKFDNFLNFRGFPDIPGEDWVVAYPKQGAQNNGKSLIRSAS